MSVLNAKCVDSQYFSKDCLLNSTKKNSLLLGHEHSHDLSVFLDFEIPQIFNKNNLNKATLVLFRLPYSYDTDNESMYSVYPLQDYFNFYYCRFNPPKSYDQYRIDFTINECSGYSEIDITNIVSAWANELIINKGLLLCCSPCSSIVKYASCCNDVKSMRPILRLEYSEKDPKKDLTCTPCNTSLQG